MTLSALAYLAEGTLPGETIQQQEQRIADGITAGLPTGWAVAWGPALSPDRGNLLYGVGNTTTNQYAVVVRGTDWSFLLNWIEDFGSMLGLTQYLGTPNDPAIQIAFGTSLGLQVLLGLTDNTTGKTVQQFVSGLPAAAGVFVTGHSLGGCLASAIAPLVSQAAGGANRVKAYTFAAPSAGNAAFATYYNSLFADSAHPGQSMAFRVYDTLDVVPNAWASLPVIKTYYQGFVLATPEIKDIVDFAQGVVNGDYSQVGVPSNGSATALTGGIVWPWEEGIGSSFDPIADALFAWQVGQQHATTNYLSLLGVPQSTGGKLSPIQALAAKLKMRSSAGA